MLAALALLAATSIGQAAPSSVDLQPDRLSATSCHGAACAPVRRESYRLPLPIEPVPNPADRAFNEDGSECGLIGHTVCTGKPHLIIGTGDHADESLSAKLRALDE